MTQKFDMEVPLVIASGHNIKFVIDDSPSSPDYDIDFGQLKHDGEKLAEWLFNHSHFAYVEWMIIKLLEDFNMKNGNEKNMTIPEFVSGLKKGLESWQGFQEDE